MHRAPHMHRDPRVGADAPLGAGRRGAGGGQLEAGARGQPGTLRASCGLLANASITRCQRAPGSRLSHKLAPATTTGMCTSLFEKIR